MADVAEMEAFLQEQVAAEAEPAQEEAVPEEPGAEEAEVTEDEADPEAEAEAEAEGEEEGAEAEAEDKPTKPGRWQRMKQRAQEAEQRYQGLERDHQELAGHAEYFHNAWKEVRQDLEFAQREIESMRAALAEYDLPHELSPDARRAMDLEREASRYKGELERFKAQQQAQQQAYVSQQAQQIASELRTEAEAYGLSPQEVTLAYVQAHQSGRRFTPAQVAANIAKASGLAKRGAMARAQVQGSRSSPKPLKPGSAATANYEASDEGMLRFLKDSGLM